jgi:hypothetical protein
MTRDIKIQKIIRSCFENRVLRRTFGPNREKLEGGWRGL